MFTVTHSAHSKGWRGITPLHSTREDVIRLLGRPDKLGDLYNLTNDVVLISYSTGTCNEGGVWNVPRDTVQRITVSPKKPFVITELDVDLAEYTTIADKHLRGIVYYNNAKEGIQIQTHQKKVTSVHYVPSANDNHLRCPAPTDGPPATKSGTPIDSHTLFDTYGKISFSLEKQRLDLLGRKLQELAGARAYIVVYNPQRMSLRQALSRANRAKRYLIGKYKLQQSSIEIIRGGSLREFMIRLYLTHEVEDPQDPTPNLANPARLLRKR
jgi:hypothetical protein